MIAEIRAQVANQLPNLTGVLALLETNHGTAPYLFTSNEYLNQLVIQPRYPLSETISKLQKQFKEDKFGIVARGCDARALIEMVKRNQIDPNRLYIFGIACSEEQAQTCYCTEPAPAIDEWPFAELIGEPTVGAGVNPLVAEYSNLSRTDRWDFWQAQFAKCIKCYGCRNICPVCFCDACALEDPLWVEPGLLVPDFPMFHLIKAMHMTTRCIACRHCEITCPADIPLTVLYDLIRDDVADLIDYTPGADVAAGPPLSLTLADAPIDSELAK
jgi:ferredoxin